jgi:hypothetical protein
MKYLKVKSKIGVLGGTKGIGKTIAIFRERRL